MDFRTIVIFVVTVLNVVSCLGQEKIKGIKFVYTNEGVEMAVAVGCTPQEFDWLHNLDFKITKDPIFIKEFTSYFGELRPDTSISHIDARIMAIVTYKYIEKKDTLCFGEYHGVDLNGTFMKDIPEFLLLVKKEVWPRDVPDTIRSIPYYWELSPEQLEEHFNNMKKSDAFQPTQQEKEFCRILINDDDL